MSTTTQDPESAQQLERDVPARAVVVQLVEKCSLDEISAGQSVRVWTRNTVYDLQVVRPDSRKVLVRGGRYFPQPRVAHLVAFRRSTTDIHTCGVDVGCPLELHSGNELIVTSPVRRIAVLNATLAW
jgi:hypothetical protein